MKLRLNEKNLPKINEVIKFGGFNLLIKEIKGPYLQYVDSDKKYYNVYADIIKK